MKIEKLSHWITILANLSVLAGIFFLIAEIQTSNDSNTISIWQTHAENAVQINLALASEDFSSLLEKAALEEELSSVEERQLRNVVNLLQTQANYIRRLYDRGIATDEELIEGYGMYRRFARIPAIRELVLRRSSQTRQLVLEDDGIEKYIQETKR